MAISTDSEAPQLAALIDRPQSYDELRARPAFSEVLDQHRHELRQVLSDYHFPNLIPCGLSDCRTPHRNGYLVETVDGLETNVGHVCGRRNFGEQFDIARAAYRRLRDRADLLAQAQRVRSHAPEIERRIAEMNRQRFGIKWVLKVRGALQALLGGPLYQSLCDSQRRGDLRVTEARQRTEEEIDDIVTATRQRREDVRFETLAVGTLMSMPWLEYAFYGKLRDGLLVPLKTFCEMNPEQLPTPKLRTALKQFHGWELVVDEAADALAEAPRFFDPANLALLPRKLPDHLTNKRRTLAEWAASKPCAALAEGLVPETVQARDAYRAR